MSKMTSLMFVACFDRLIVLAVYRSAQGEDRRYYQVRPSTFFFNLGAGMNLMLTPRVGLRFGADFRIDPAGVWLQGDSGMGRVVAGMVFAIP